MDKGRVSLFQYFKHLSGQFKDEKFDSDRPKNKTKTTCHETFSFIQTTLMDGLKTGEISWFGRVGEVEPPFLVLPLRVEPTTP